MQLKLPENLMRMILPGLFLTYIAATVLAFLLHAQYFNDVLAKTFAQPSFPTQVAVNLPLLNRVALLIKLDQDNIAALTTSVVRKATSSEPIAPSSTLEAVPMPPTDDAPGSATTTTLISSSTPPTGRRP